MQAMGDVDGHDGHDGHIGASGASLGGPDTHIRKISRSKSPNSRSHAHAPRQSPMTGSYHSSPTPEDAPATDTTGGGVGAGFSSGGGAAAAALAARMHADRIDVVSDSRSGLGGLGHVVSAALGRPYRQGSTGTAISAASVSSVSVPPPRFSKRVAKMPVHSEYQHGEYHSYNGSSKQSTGLPQKYTHDVRDDRGHDRRSSGRQSRQTPHHRVGVSGVGRGYGHGFAIVTWKEWKTMSKNRFMCRGRLMCGTDVHFFLFTNVLLVGPSVLYCIFVFSCCVCVTCVPDSALWFISWVVSRLLG